MLGVQSKIENSYEAVKKKEKVRQLFKVLLQYMHLGKIIHYANDKANLELFRDDQFQSSSSAQPFRNNTGIRVPTKINNGSGGSVMAQLEAAHLFFPRAFAFDKEDL